MRYFRSTNRFIEEALDSNGKVLVHCFAGKSRSASCVLAYIMKKWKIPFDQALEYCKKHRERVNPNDSFKEQLKKYEKQVMAKEKEDLDEFSDYLSEGEDENAAMEERRRFYMERMREEE